MKTSWKHNFFSLAGLCIGLHYQQIIREGYHCPIPVICGEHRLWKTKSARLALRRMGNDHHFFSSAREWFIPHLCSRSSFPPVLDDLKNAHQLGDIALAYYDGSKDSTCAKGMEPKTRPLVTMNWGALYGLLQWGSWKILPSGGIPPRNKKVSSEAFTCNHGRWRAHNHHPRYGCN